MKTESFIYKLLYTVKHNTFDKVKTLHERIKQININELHDREKVNPYQLFSYWLLDVVQFGLLLTIPISVLWIGYQGFLKSLMLIFALGIVWWLILEFVASIKQKINE